MLQDTVSIVQTANSHRGVRIPTRLAISTQRFLVLLSAPDPVLDSVGFYSSSMQRFFSVFGFPVCSHGRAKNIHEQRPPYVDLEIQDQAYPEVFYRGSDTDSQLRAECGEPLTLEQYPSP